MRAGAPDLELPAVAFDPALVGEVVPLTAALIRARPENPPGDERRVVDVLAARLQDTGLEVTVADFGGDGRRANLKAVLRGRDPLLPPLLLLGHSDVVSADPEEWRTPPYEALIEGDRLFGRGALDMLSMVALETLAMIALAQREEPPARDVIFVVVGDVEGEGRGLVEAWELWPELKRAAHALTEGGMLIESALRPGEDLAAIAVAEKGVFQFRLEARGAPGHGSAPPDDTAPDRLVRAVARLRAREAPFTITAVTARQLRDIGAARGGVEGLVLSSPGLARAFGQPLLDDTPAMRALYRDTCALTVLEAGIKRSAIPATATATFDCRLLPGTDPAAFRDRLLATMGDPRVALTVLHAAPASASDPDGVVVRALRARIRRELPGAAVVASLSPGATACRFLRARENGAVPCYGFVPVRVTKDELESIHGRDEAVRVPELERGLGRLVDVVTFLADLPESR
jgi:acetylornithine deacetylase/succinyl-diaminopimelate desuccinylase-like protein